MGKRLRYPIVNKDRFNYLKGTDVASATSIILGKGNFFDLTGTTTTAYIKKAGWKAGSPLVIRTTGALTLTHQGGAAPTGYAKLRLVGAADISMTAKDVICLIYDGTEFTQVSPTLVTA